MKNKKGFTLIELLAVVIIIGILLIIAVPAVSRYLTKGTINYYNSLENNIVLAGREYLNDYRALFPREIGNVTVIELNELVSNNYIDEIKDDNGNVCEAKMTVKKIGKNDYEYYSCLICEGYQTVAENCEYSEDNNVTADSKNYSIEVEKDSYTVNHGANFTLPLAKAYYLGQLVSSNVTASPKVIDTNKLGTTIVRYAYKGATKSITVKVVDNVKPSIPQVALRYDNASGTNYDGKWHNGNVYVEFKSTDYSKNNIVGSGISYYEVSIDNKKTWQKLIGNNITHTDSGNLTYHVRAVDKAGHQGDSNTYNIKIDKTQFECIITASGTEGSNGWYTSNVGLTLAPNKELPSGIKLSNLSQTSVTTNTTGQQINATVTSGSGIVATCSKTIKLDKKTPETPTITANDSKASGSWHTADTTLSLSGSQSTSGITYYFDTKQDPTTKQSSKTISTNTTTNGITYYAKACNGAGTCSDVSSYLLKLDKSTPSCSIVVSGTKGNNEWYTSDVSLSLDIIETPSLIATQSLDPNKITTNTTGQEVVGVITTNAGIVATCKLTVKVDKNTPSAPTITANDNKGSGSWHTADTTLTAGGSSSTSGITYYMGTDQNKVKAKDSTTKQSSIIIKTNTASTTYYAMACNGAGACSGVSNYVLKLDKTTPSCSLAASDGIGSGSWHTANYNLNLGTLNNTSGNSYYIDTNSNPTTSRSSLTVSSNTAGTTYYGKVCSGAGLCSNVCNYSAKLDTSNPGISVSISGKTATLSLSDNLAVSGYGVNQSKSSQPSWTAASGTSTSKTWNASAAGTYVAWVKDASGRTSSAEFTIDKSAFGAVVTYTVDSNTSYNETVYNGNSVLSPTTFTPSKSGYTFVGWREDKTASGSVLTSKTMSGSPMTLYAVFKKKITVTYYDNSTTASTTDKNSYYNNGDIINPSFTLTQASKSEWTERGWSTTNAGNASITYDNGATFTIDSDITLYGLYQQTITLSYGGNGATSGSTAAHSETRYWAPAGYVNPTFTLKGCGFAKTNYAFSKWAMGATNGTQYAAGAKVTLSANTTFHAIWSVANYSIHSSSAITWTNGISSVAADSRGEDEESYVYSYSSAIDVSLYKTLVWSGSGSAYMNYGGGNITIKGGTYSGGNNVFQYTVKENAWEGYNESFTKEFNISNISTLYLTVEVYAYSNTYAYCAQTYYTSSIIAKP